MINHEQRVARMEARVQAVRRAALLGRTLEGMDAPYENDVPYLLALLAEEDPAIQRVRALATKAALHEAFTADVFRPRRVATVDARDVLAALDGQEGS